MNARFFQYLRAKKLSQKTLADLSCVPPSTISRFLAGHPIASDKLLKLLNVCDDLNLSWLFFNSGEMLKTEGNVTYNLGKYSGIEMNGSPRNVKVGDVKGHGTGEVSLLRRQLQEKDRIIAEKDAVIGRRDETIERLQSRLMTLMGDGARESL